MAVVIATVCRPSLVRAVRSVYEQDIDQPIQLLVGVDIDRFGQAEKLRRRLSKECPPHVDLVWLQSGYSTARRHGGVHRCFFGGALRTTLSFLANAPVITYLDDDDWYAPDHLRRLLSAAEGKDWAYSLCHYAERDGQSAGRR